METSLRFQWVIAGALFGLLVGDVADRPGAARAGDAAPVAPALVHPRALRTAPGVGRLRALDVSGRAWAAGPPGALSGGLESIPGVGPRTAEAIRQVLDGDGFPLRSCDAHAGGGERTGSGRRWPPRAVAR